MRFLASNDAKEIAALMDKIPDPVGTLYGYGGPAWSPDGNRGA
jgi:hypothetical protein